MSRRSLTIPPPEYNKITNEIIKAVKKGRELPILRYSLFIDASGEQVGAIDYSSKEFLREHAESKKFILENIQEDKYTDEYDSYQIPAQVLKSLSIHFDMDNNRIGFCQPIAPI